MLEMRVVGGLRSVVAASVVAAALGGCGTDNHAAAKDHPEAGAGIDGAVPGVDAGTGMDAGKLASDAAPEAEAGPAYYVEVTALYFSALLRSVYATAGAAADRPGSACAGTQSGACCFVGGPASTGSLPDGGAGPSAGDITFTNTTGDTAVLSPPYTSASLAWNPGDVLQVSAAGADIGAFTASIHTPPAIAGINPSFDTLQTLSASSALTVAWTAGSDASAQVVLTLTASSANDTVGTITCAAKDSAGQVVVDASLMGHFAAGQDATLSLLRTVTTAGSSANAATYVTGGWQTGAIPMFQ
jgi:hypothetical protein